MLLSICIPTYNGGAYLEACLESVCKQTYTDFEILVCDDCSSDNTIEIIKDFQKKDARIKLFVNEKNLGLVGNWNRCIELAKGEWVKFIFQDDFISSTCLQSMLQVTDDKTQMVVCEREYLFEEGTSDEIKGFYDVVPRLHQFFGNEEAQYVSANQLSLLINKYFPANFIGEPTSIMFRKSIADVVGLFNPKIAQLCDLEYCLRIGTRDGFIYIPDKFVSFRVHGAATSQKNGSEKYFASVFGDKIYILYLLLFDSLYLDFRKNYTNAELRKLKYRLFYMVYHADLYVKTEDKGNMLLKEMQELKNLCPEIKQFKKYYPLYATVKFWAGPIRMKLNSLIKKKD